MNQSPEIPVIPALKTFQTHMPKHLFCLVFFALSVVAHAGSSGTGFLVSADGLVATSNHVIEDGHSIQFNFKGQKYDARKVAQDEANDLAILKVEGEFPFLEIRGSEDASIGEEIFTVGFPNPAIQGFEPKMTTGVISSLSGIQDDPTCYQISVPVQPGNSGGPLLTQQGDVIGIIKAKLNPRVGLATANALPENVNYAVKSDYLNILIKLAKAKVKKADAKHQAKNPAEPLQGVDKALACVGLVEVSHRKQSPEKSHVNVGREVVFEAEPPFWNELMREIDDVIKLRESVDLVNLDDPWEDYLEIRPRLHERVQKFMDEWKNAVKGYNAWVNGGLIGSAIRDGQYEEEFKRFRKETDNVDLKSAKIVRKNLAFHKTSRAKIYAHDKYLLPEKYETEFRDRFLDQNVSEIHGETLRESVSAAKTQGKNSAYPQSKIAFSDRTGIAFSDPTISEPNGVNLYTFEYINSVKQDRMVYEDKDETGILVVSYVSGDPYLICIPKKPRGEIITVPTEASK